METLPNVSLFGFGTAYLHHLTQKHQNKILNTAIENGITHFDTAPFYGSGVAERALSSISNKNNITVASKFGLYPRGGSDQRQLEAICRKLAGKILPSINKEIIDFSITVASKSLDGTRRRIKRDYLDYFFLHEPCNFLGAEEVLDSWLKEQVKLGNILNYGLAGNLNNINLKKSSFFNNLQTNYEYIKLKKNTLNKNLSTTTFFSYHWLNELSPEEIKKKILFAKSAANKGHSFNECYLFSTKNINRFSDYAL